MKQIDELSQDKVYADPIRKLQEEMLQSMLALREGLAKSIGEACKNGGGSGGDVSKEKYDKVCEENKKLKYRIKHLVRALDEKDGGSGAAFKLYTVDGPNSIQVNQCQITAAFTGSKLQIVQVDDGMRASKEHKALNPTGNYPLLETDQGSLVGVVAICKYLCKQSKKLLGDGGALQLAQIDQWVNWSMTTLDPTSQNVLKGVFGKNEVYASSWNDSMKELKNQARYVDGALEKGNGFLVGGQMTLADLMVATALLVPLQTVLDGGVRKATKIVPSWAEKFFATQEF